MRILVLISVILVSACNGNVESECEKNVDWELVGKLAAQIQSASDRKNSADLLAPVKRLLDMIPSENTNYMVGISVGARAAIAYEATGHLTGSHSTIGLNQLNIYGGPCTYISKLRKGKYVLVTGEAQDIAPCDIPWYDVRTFPKGVKPLVSPHKIIKTMTKYEPSKVDSVLNGNAAYFQAWADYPVALNLDKINMATAESNERVEFLFGITTEKCHGDACFKFFKNFAQIEVSPRDGKVITNSNSFYVCGEKCDKAKALYESMLETGFQTAS